MTQPEQPTLPLPFPALEPLTDAEALGVVAVALAGPARLAREASCFMASICAAELVDKLRLAGILLVREGPQLRP